jgi:hypothetical protein
MSIVKTHLVVLVKGYSDNDGYTEKKVELRPINGYDQQSLASLPDNTAQPLKTTELLCRITRFEPERSSMRRSVDSIERLNRSKEFVRSLTIGDRIALMLCSRKATFGDTLHLELTCSYCNKMVSCDVSIDYLLIRRNERLRDGIMSIKYRGYDLNIRPITGKDQEKLLKQQLHHPDPHHPHPPLHKDRGKFDGLSLEEDRFKEKEEDNWLSEFLIRKCIIRSTPKLPKKKLSSSFVSYISSKLEELDPQADIVFKSQCPYCNNIIQDYFDAEDFVLREVDLYGRGLYQEVNYLAFFYHWTEDAILALPILKRKKYVDLIDRMLIDRGTAHE